MKYLIAILLVTLCLAQEGSNPWKASELLEPASLAKELGAGKAPTVICVAFPVLYRSKHIAKAVYAGPGSKQEGLDMLKAAVASVPKDANLVIYCGCCPMVKCPNIRPAYKLLKELGYSHIRVLDIPSNMHDDWFSQGYPGE